MYGNYNQGYNAAPMDQNLAGDMSYTRGVPSMNQPQGGTQGYNQGYNPGMMDQSQYGDSYAHGGHVPKKKKRGIRLKEAYMSPDEIMKLFDAQGGPEYDRVSGRPVLKKLGKLLDNPYIEHAIRKKYQNGGSTDNPLLNGRTSFNKGGGCYAGGGEVGQQPNIMDVIRASRELGMQRPGFNKGGHVTDYKMPERSPAHHDQYARGTDTTIVYITPKMEKLLDECGLSTTNPHNGKKEYFNLSDMWGGLKNFGSTVGNGLANVGSAAYNALPSRDDVWNGAKNAATYIGDNAETWGKQGLGALNAMAPSLSKMAQPLINEYVPEQYRGLANAIDTNLPDVISSLNGYVNPADPSQKAQAQQQLQQSGANFGANVGNQFAGMYNNNPYGQAAQGGFQSYLNNPNNWNWQQGAQGAFNGAYPNMPQNAWTQAARIGINSLTPGGGVGSPMMPSANQNSTPNTGETPTGSPTNYPPMGWQPQQSQNMGAMSAPSSPTSNNNSHMMPPMGGLRSPHLSQMTNVRRQRGG